MPACQPSIVNESTNEVIAGARKVGTKKPVTPQELSAITAAFADRYVLLMRNACDTIKQTATDPLQRQRAHLLKTNSAASVYDIVTNPDPYTQLLDLTVAITLQSMLYIDDDMAEKTYGVENARVLMTAMRKARVEVWEIAARTLTEEQLDNLDFMIWDYYRNNQDMLHVINVRFGDFAGSRGKSLVEDVTATGLLATLDEARKSVDETRMLAERSFYYFKRAPLLLAWRSEATIDDILVKPEVRSVLKSVDDASSSIKGITASVDRIPEAAATERKAIIAAFDEREGKLGNLMKETRAALESADAVAKSSKDLMVELQRASDSVGELIKKADVIAANYYQGHPANGKHGAAQPQPSPTAPAPAAPAASAPAGAAETPAQTAPPLQQQHPFDIRDYTKALAELSGASKEVNKVVTSSHDLLAAQEWKTRLEEINASADDRVRLATAQSQALVDTIFMRVYIGLGLMFVLIVLGRVVAFRIISKLQKKKEIAS
jgi:hypothetical protein